MSLKQTINHSGTIISIECNKILVRIQSHSACGSCHSKSLCHIAGTDEKIIEIDIEDGEKKYSIGEIVNVKTSMATGNKAVVLGYVVPLMVLLVTMFGSNYFLKNENIAGVVALAATALYYFFLWLLRDSIKKKIIFQIEKQIL